MTCNHCKSSVEKNLTALDSIDQVSADPQQNIVIVEGDADQSVIEKVINELGFKFKGERS
jgi:copper chaperone CopZ